MMSSKEKIPSSSSGKSEAIETKPSRKKILRPWYICGGMKWVNYVGMATNVFGAFYVLQLGLDSWNTGLLCALWALLVFLSAAQGMTTFFCVLVVPTYFASLLLLFTLDDKIKIATMAIALGVTKVTICSSTCLHRYAAHGAFQCGPVTSHVLMLLSCLSNQGGPLWWASLHRCHHKFCDQERDPHSPIVGGIEKTFAFFVFHPRPKEEFVPKKLDTTLIRIMDTWTCTVPILEQVLAYMFFQREGLFVTFTSAWLSQCMTLWFNVVNHPIPEEDANPPKKGSCMASDDKRKPTGFYLPFYFLDLLHPLFASLSCEAKHEHHHDFPQLAKRTKYDAGYWFFMFPLEQLGLIWNVNM